MFQVKWFEKAVLEQKRIIEFWIKKNHSTAYSKKIYDEIKQIETLLMQNPFLGVETKYPNIRRCVFLKNFALFYKVEERSKTCYIIYFWDNRQSPEILEKEIG